MTYPAYPFLPHLSDSATHSFS